MATCGTCKAQGQTVEHIRACSDAVALAPLLPQLAPGNVVTLANADGYWVIVRISGSAPNTYVAEQVLANGKQGAWSYIHGAEVELWFPNVAVATDYQVALDQAAERNRVAGILHGDETYCRGCAKNWYAAKWHRADCPVVAARETTAKIPAPVTPQQQREDGPWAAVSKLRAAIKLHLVRKIRNATVGHFALRTDNVVKFYRVKHITAGTYAGRVFVDAQASGDFWPVKAPATLTEVLTGILADPQAAMTLYGTELKQCYRCNRTLTDEISRALGIGPECRSK